MKRAFLCYLFSLLLFGSNGIVASFIALDSSQIVLLRTMIGSALLILIFFLGPGTLHIRTQKKQFACLCLSGMAMGASWMFLYEAYARIGVSIASLLYYCGPVLVMALSPILFREKLTAGKLLGFAAVLAGVFLVNGGASTQGADPLGIACGLLSAVLYAVMVIFNKQAAAITGLENSMIQLFVSFLTAAVCVGCRQGFAMNLQPGSLLPILFLGLVNTGIGCYCYFSSIGRLPVQTVAICGYLEPLSAVVFSLLFLHEAMNPAQVLGASCILGGVAFSERASH